MYIFCGLLRFWKRFRLSESLHIVDKTQHYDVKCPQGLILRPLFLLLFINDLPYFLLKIQP